MLDGGDDVSGDAAVGADSNGVDAQRLQGVIVRVDRAEYLLEEAFIRWDDPVPGLCLSDRPVNDMCGLNDKSDMIVLFARYVVSEDGSAELSLVQTNLRVIEAGQEGFFVAMSGTLEFSVYEPTTEVATGSIDVTFEESATAAGGFTVP